MGRQRVNTVTLLKGSTYLALMISSTLLFMMQPWVYSWMVPHFGGGAHLWAAVLVFFSGALRWPISVPPGDARFGSRQLYLVFVALAGIAIWQVVDLLTLSPGVTSEGPRLWAGVGLAGAKG